MFQRILQVATNTTSCSSVRCISTSLARSRQIKQIEWDDIGNSRFKEMRKTSNDPLLAYQDYGDRKPGIKKADGTFEVIPEMIPDIIVPDLTGFKLKPYVSYRAPDVKREEFSAEQLFKVVYQDKIVEDFKNNALMEDGQPKEPSTEETVTPDQAFMYARKTGSDMFEEVPEDPDPVEVRIFKG